MHEHVGAPAFSVTQHSLVLSQKPDGKSSYPALHAHANEPSVLMHAASAAQLCVPRAHSSTVAHAATLPVKPGAHDSVEMHVKPFPTMLLSSVRQANCRPPVYVAVALAGPPEYRTFPGCAASCSIIASGDAVPGRSPPAMRHKSGPDSVS